MPNSKSKDVTIKTGLEYASMGINEGTVVKNSWSGERRLVTERRVVGNSISINYHPLSKLWLIRIIQIWLFRKYRIKWFPAFYYEFIFAWYDLWIGLFWDKKKKWLYVFPVPCVGVIFKFKN